jgi:ribonuclease HIII
MSNSYSEKFNLSEAQSLKTKLQDENYSFCDAEHAIWRAKGKNVVVTLYKSGKLLAQGSGTQDFVTAHIQKGQLSLINVPKSKQSDDISHDFESWIGTDESGKGDYFGPLIIAGVLIDEKNKKLFEELGLKDSKKLTDEKISKLSVQIKNNAIFSIVTINPNKYNELYKKFNNLNKMLAWGHARAIENILEKTPCLNAISDKFGDEKLIKNALMQSGKTINLIQKVRAERDLAVAAASIIARDEFVKKIYYLSKEYKLDLPKGASDRVVAQAKLAKSKNIPLENIAKLHFKTTQIL